LWGEPVVRAAISAHSHYLDISGEQTHIKRVFDAYSESAELAGVSVVPMVNDGGFLADLLVGLTARRVGRVTDVVVAHRSAGSPGLSRGSGRSAVANMELFTAGGLGYRDGEWRVGVPAKRTSIVFPGSSDSSPVVKFAMPEIITVPRHVAARHVEGVADAGLAAAFTGVTPEMVESLPEGPRADLRQAGRFTLVAEVDGDLGRARGVVEGSDTYGTTAVVVVEAARRLLGDGAKGGVLAPAQAFDAADFLDFLGPYGVRWSVTAG
jgi:short subunit dehydrogenase-like uncharacterized protein